MILPTRFTNNNLMNAGGRYIYMDGDDTSKYNAVREKLIEKFAREMVVILTLIFIALLMCGLPALYMLVFKRARITLLGIELPFFEKDSDIGFVLNLTMQAVIAVFGIVGMIAIEFGQNLIHHVVYSIPHLMHVDTEELGTELRTNGMSLAARAQLRNIFMKVQDFEKYLKKIQFLINNITHLVYSQNRV